MNQAIEKRRSVTAGAVAYLLLLALCIALINPFVNTGVSDDFSYIRSAQDFARTGRFIYNGGATAMLGWLIPFGAIFAKLFGSSFITVRIASFFIAAVNGLLLQWIFVQLGCNRVLALFGATAVMLSPASLPQAFLFFSDGPGLLAMLVTVALCIRIVRSETPRATQLWIAAAFFASFLLGTVRQLLWMSTLVMVPCAVWLVRKRKGVLPSAAACFALSVTGIIVLLRWWQHQPYFLGEPLILHYPRSQWSRFLILPGMELLVLMAPVFSIFLLRPVSKRRYVSSAALALLTALALRRNPFHLLHDGSREIFPGAPEWVFLLVTAYATGLLPIILRPAYEALIQHRQTTSREKVGAFELCILLAPFSLVVFVLVSSRAAFFTRYLLELTAVLTIWFVKVWSDQTKARQGCGIIAPLLLGVYCAFSVIMTHDTLRSCAAVLSLTQWYTQHGMPRDQLEAGFAFDGTYQIDRTGYVNDPRITVPAGAYVEHDLPAAMAVCHNFFLPATPSIYPVYGIGDSLAPCFVAPTLHSITYTAWMPPHRRSLFIARFAPQYALPVH